MLYSRVYTKRLSSHFPSNGMKLQLDFSRLLPNSSPTLAINETGLQVLQAEVPEDSFAVVSQCSSCSCIVLCKVWVSARCIPAYELVAGQQISYGELRTSSDGVYKFVMQSHCNLVLNHNCGGAIRYSNAVRDISNCYFFMQTDGNAVIYGGSTSNAVSAPSTNGRNDVAHYIEVQDDVNIVT